MYLIHLYMNIFLKNKIYFFLFLLSAHSRLYSMSVEMADFKKIEKDNRGTIIRAIWDDDAETIKDLINQNVNMLHHFNHSNIYNEGSILHLCVRQEAVKCLKELLKIKNIDLNFLNSNEGTPLNQSVNLIPWKGYHGGAQLEMMQVLIENGADINHIYRGSSILDRILYFLDHNEHLRWSNHNIDQVLEFIELLLAYGADTKETYKFRIRDKEINEKLQKVYCSHKQKVLDKLEESDILPTVLNNIVCEYII